MTQEQKQPPLDTLRTPEVSRLASQFIVAVETATPEHPASLAILTGKTEEELVRSYKDKIRHTDDLYERHEELFNTASGHGFDYEAILALTRDALVNINEPFHKNAAYLAIGTMQYAEAAAQLINHPSLMTIDKGVKDRKGAIINKAVQIANEAFDQALAARISGNIQKVPASLFTYPGYLLDTLVGFWASAYPQAPSSIQAQFGELLPRLPAKKLIYDEHSLQGRPDRSHARKQYGKQVDTFIETLRNGETGGAGAEDNIGLALQFTLDALDTICNKGYSAEEALRIVVQNSSTIGQLTELTTPIIRQLYEFEINPFQLEEHPSGHRLIINNYLQPKYRYDFTPLFTRLLAQRLEQRNKRSGTCPARQPVPLRHGGETYENVELVSSTVEQRLGVKPPLLRKVSGEYYADPAALTVSYAVLSLVSAKVG